MTSHHRGRLLVFALLLALPWLSAAPGLAESGAWVSRDHSSVRLLQGERTAHSLAAGLEIVLGDGWKTYWRMPGESGVPPEFDWSRSTNVAAVDVQWPAPYRLHDASGETIGYKGHVVLPLTVTLTDQATPARLALSLFYAACNDICVPATAELHLDLAAGAADQADADLVRHYSGLVPLEDADGTALLAAAARQEAGKPVLAIVVSSELAADGPAADIFVEGFDAAYFRAPRRGAETAAGREFTLAIDGIGDAGELAGRSLTVTWVSERRRLFRRLEVH